MYSLLPRNAIEAQVIRRIKKLELKPDINKDKLIELVELLVKSLSFKLRNKFYQHPSV